MHGVWPAIRSIAFMLVVMYAGTLVFLYVFQSRLLYFPYREIERTPGDAGLKYSDAVFVTRDGVKLHGWFVPAVNPRGVILFCHGNAGNISHRLETIGIFNRLGLSTFIFDYRGYGVSEGKPTEAGTYADGEAALAWLEEHQNVTPGDIIFFGRSLGGAVAAHLARKSTPKALILESTFTSVDDIGRDLYPWVPVRLLSRFDYSTIGMIGDVRCPVLVIHSPDDELVPFSHARRLYERASEPKDFLTLTGDHNAGFLRTGDRYVAGLDAFLTERAGWVSRAGASEKPERGRHAAADSPDGRTSDSDE